jgi:hypothetical protein
MSLAPFVNLNVAAVQTIIDGRSGNHDLERVRLRGERRAEARLLLKNID